VLLGGFRFYFRAIILINCWEEEGDMKRILITAVLVSLFFEPVSGTVEGATFCVNTPETFQAALNTGASNGEDDIIRVVQGTYIGNFSYNSSELFSLTMIRS